MKKVKWNWTIINRFKSQITSYLLVLRQIVENVDLPKMAFYDCRGEDESR